MYFRLNTIRKRHVEIYEKKNKIFGSNLHKNEKLFKIWSGLLIQEMNEGDLVEIVSCRQFTTELKSLFEKQEILK